MCKEFCGLYIELQFYLVSCICVHSASRHKKTAKYYILNDICAGSRVNRSPQYLRELFNDVPKLDQIY